MTCLSGHGLNGQFGVGLGELFAQPALHRGEIGLRLLRECTPGLRRPITVNQVSSRRCANGASGGLGDHRSTVVVGKLERRRHDADDGVGEYAPRWSFLPKASGSP